MQINEIIAETIVNKIFSILGKEIVLADVSGNVLASTDLSKTHKNYTQMQQSAQSGKILEVGKEEFGFIKEPLPVGIIIPLTYSGDIIGTIYIQDEPSNYNKYSPIVKTTAELLLHQTMVIDNVPYKDRIKDNFIFGLLHRKISWDDQRTYDEAELLEVGLHKDKVVVVVYVPGFWQEQFQDIASASEDERQVILHSYKKKIYESVKEFYGDTGNVQVSYFGNDTFVVLIDEGQNLKGTQMVPAMRNKGSVFNSNLLQRFDKNLKRVAVSVGNFYKGKDGIALAYEEAKVALQLGMSVDENKLVYHVDDLGMIAILAGGNKRWQESFVRNLLTQLLSEKYLIETVDMFFEQNMSLTQTAKKLGIHRNTLLYRLSKVKKITGLDPRKFNDAIKIKLASLLSFLHEKEKIL